MDEYFPQGVSLYRCYIIGASMIVHINSSDPELLLVTEKPYIDWLPKDGESYRTRPVAPGREFLSRQCLHKLANQLGKELPVAYPEIRKMKEVGIPYNTLKSLPTGEWIEIDEDGNLLKVFNTQLIDFEEALKP